MSRIRAITDFPRNEQGLVDHFLGTAYDVVKFVALNFERIEDIEEAILSIPHLAECAIAIPKDKALTEMSELLENSIKTLKELEQDIFNNFEIFYDERIKILLQDISDILANAEDRLETVTNSNINKLNNLTSQNSKRLNNETNDHLDNLNNRYSSLLQSLEEDYGRLSNLLTNLTEQSKNSINVLTSDSLNSIETLTSTKVKSLNNEYTKHFNNLNETSNTRKKEINDLSENIKVELVEEKNKHTISLNNETNSHKSVLKDTKDAYLNDLDNKKIEIITNLDEKENNYINETIANDFGESTNKAISQNKFTTEINSLNGDKQDKLEFIGNGKVMREGAFGLGSNENTIDTSTNIYSLNSGFYGIGNYHPDNPLDYGATLLVNKRNIHWSTYIAIASDGRTLKFGGANADSVLWNEAWHEKNTTIDSNGFLKAASPIIRLFNDHIETNGQFKEEPVFEKIGTGTYKISNTLGLAKEGWAYEKPRGKDGNPYFNIKVDKLEDGCIISVHDVYEVLEEATITDIDGNERKINKIVKILGEARDIKPHERWIDLRFHEEAKIGE